MDLLPLVQYGAASEQNSIDLEFLSYKYLDNIHVTILRNLLADEICFFNIYMYM